LDKDDHPTDRFSSKSVDPISIAVYGNELFVVDFTALVVKVLDRASGRYLRTIGSVGTEEGQFTKPLCVRVDSSGVVFVDDVLTCHVHRFSRDGKFLSMFGRTGNQAGDLVRPKHMAFDNAHNLYIVDAAFNNVQVFDNQQKVSGYFGSAGSHPGAMELPAGVFVDQSPEDVAIFQQYVHPAFQAEMLIVVTNQFGPSKVCVYAGGHLKPGKTVADITLSRAKVAPGTANTNASTQPLFMPENTATPTTRPAESAK
jgi:DNA-binding beta-propeller fold protein YncE